MHTHMAVLAVTGMQIEGGSRHHIGIGGHQIKAAQQHNFYKQP